MSDFDEYDDTLDFVDSAEIDESYIDEEEFSADLDSSIQGDELDDEHQRFRTSTNESMILPKYKVHQPQYKEVSTPTHSSLADNN